MKIRTTVLCFCIFLAATASEAQIASYLHMAAIGADGTEAIEADDSESSLDDFQELILKNFPFKQKEVTTIELNEDLQKDVQLFLSNTYKLSAEDDLFVMGLFGAWDAGKFVASKENKISADYIQNLLEYLPAKTSLCVIVSPADHSFPDEIFGAQQQNFQGGKIIVVLKNSPDNDYDDVLSSLISVLDDLADSGEDYSGADGNILFSEWLTQFNKLMLEEEVVPTYYKLSGGPNYIINSINK